MFYLELAGHCLSEAYRCDSTIAAMGLRKLAQGYIDTAEALQEATKASTPQPTLSKRGQTPRGRIRGSFHAGPRRQTHRPANACRRGSGLAR
jgi:hypothetical protein